MRRSLWILPLLFLATVALAANVGVFQRSDCTTLTPATGKTFCFDQTANSLKTWDGTQWVDIAANREGIYNVKDFGAAGDGTTDDSVAVQATIDAAGPSGTVYFPGDETTTYVVNSGLTLPKRSVTGGGGGTTAIALVGPASGKGPKIERRTAGVLIDGASNSVANRDEYRIFRNLRFSGFNASEVDTATIGLDLHRNSHFWVQDSWFEGFTTAAIRIGESVSYNITGNKFIDIEGKGIDGTPSGVNDFNNGGNITGNTFATIGGWMIDFIDFKGGNIQGNTFDGSAGDGAIRIQNTANGAIIGNEFEHVAPILDVGTQLPGAQGLVFEGNFIGGVTGAATVAPLQLRRTDGMSIRFNYLYGGTRFINFVTPFSIRNTRIEDNTFASAVTLTLTNLFANLPAQFADHTRNSRLIHAQVDTNNSALQPLDTGNMLTGDLPLGALDPTVVGTSTFVKANKLFRGSKAVGTLTRGDNTAALSRGVTLGAGDHSNARGRFVTFEIWAQNTTGTNATMRMSPDNGATKTSFGVDANTDWRPYRITFAVASDAVNIIPYVDVTSGAVDLAGARLYVGAAPADHGQVSGVPYWSDGAAPTTGTWARGDFIWSNVPAGATPTIGWTCTVAGTPGTWVAVVAN